MASQEKPKPTTPPLRLELRCARLVAAVGVALVIAAAILAATVILANRPAWWRGLLAASLSSLIAAACSLLPLCWGVRRGLQPAVVGFFIAGALRAVISLGACVVAIRVGDYPAAPTLLLMVPYYFAVLAAESAVLGRAMWLAHT